MISRFLITLFFIFGAVEAVDIHAFLVIDFEAIGIEDSMRYNYARWERELKKIERYTDIVVKWHVHHDMKFLEDLKNLEPDPDDVILFYWSGHGFRSSQKDVQKNPWPSFLFENIPDAAIDFDELTKLMEAKGARLLIAIAETCNQQIPFFFSPPHLNLNIKGEKTTTLLERVQRNMHELYVRPSGVVKLASSQPGQMSYVNTESMSFFTCAFLEVYKNEVYLSDSISWEEILTKATNFLIELNHHDEQVPLIDIALQN